VVSLFDSASQQWVVFALVHDEGVVDFALFAAVVGVVELAVEDSWLAGVVGAEEAVCAVYAVSFTDL
jgi:hypothetical protein